MPQDLNAQSQSPSSDEYRVVCWGELVWDCFDDGPRLGGGAANVAYHLRGLGARVELVSVVGGDELGDRALAALAAARVGNELVQRDATGPTGAVHITPAPEGADGEPRFERIHRARSDELRFEPRARPAFQNADAVCFTADCQGTLLAAAPLAEALAETSSHCLRICDLNLRPSSAEPRAVQDLTEHSDVVKLNEDELAVLESSIGSSDGVSWLLARGVRWVTVTRGRRGATLATGDTRFEHPGYGAHAGGDTVGAGDAFLAVLTYRLLEASAGSAPNDGQNRVDLARVLDAANRYASFVASQRGAQPPVPKAVRTAARGAFPGRGGRRNLPEKKAKDRRSRGAGRVSLMLDDANGRAGTARSSDGEPRGLDFRAYNPENDRFYDEMFEKPGVARPGFEALVSAINGLAAGTLEKRQRGAERALFSMGITFTLGDSDGAGLERILPFDIIPRVIGSPEWKKIEAGLKQRITALNLFLSDVYGKQAIVRDNVVPRYLIESCGEFRPQCVGLMPPRGVWIQVTGTDLVRDRDGNFFVLEDNTRCPSGVSYVLENRQVLKRTFPRVFERMAIRPVDDYPMRLLDSLRFLATDRAPDPRVVVLTPGRYNSAYYEHAFLAQQMGVELVEPQDLVVQDGDVCMRTTDGLSRVDVIYRRIGDDFLDPEVFRPDSLLGVPGIVKAYLDGRVALANAPGTGVADDKAIYAYVEKIIRYYLDQEPILSNVPTYICSDEEQRRYVLEHLSELVVKATDGAGGYGMLVGPHASPTERQDFAGRIQKNPRGYIAQPTLMLSRSPTIIGRELSGRHVDLRPFALFGREVYVQPGGLTRVALRSGSLVVNSSQGGGTKDTWVLAEP